MKGRAVSRKEKAFHDALVSVVGCIACRKDGVVNHHCSIHHIEGRTKVGAHMRVLSLCAGHHQDGTGAPGLIAVHPWKARFEKLYGSQEQLLAECLEKLKEKAA